jgi:hypothetical protein
MGREGLAQLEKEYNALLKHCKELSLFIEQLLAVPEGRRDTGLQQMLSSKIAEHQQASAELKELVKLLIDARNDVFTVMRPKAGGLCRSGRRSLHRTMMAMET